MRSLWIAQRLSVESGSKKNARAGRIRPGPASFKGRRSRTRGRNQCLPRRVRIGVSSEVRLHVNELHKIRHYHARYTEERRRRIIESVDSLSRDERDSP